MKLYSASPNAAMSMQKDPVLDSWLDRLVREHGVRHAVETGTYLGTGSTATLAGALTRNHATEPRLDTIEVNWAHCCAARRNLAAFPFVACHWGLTVRFDEAVAFINRDGILAAHHDEPDIYIDATDNPREFYLNEVRGQIQTPVATDLPPPAQQPPDNLLLPLLDTTPAANALILLDSAGGIGLLEFQVTLAAMRKKSFFLLLDDTGHIKHYRSRRIVEQHDRFKILALGKERDWLLAVHQAEP